ncbi:DUF29 domain-containing protein [Candidatus Entotheonella palauensis]|uniref:DUF29 domain-containing protein n=1 Tax=Candidatus Entotheonella palauensis TaxID=93172 RepID=UPI000B7F38DE|nr:DUF29 domain-containing protein [Candidatus Entotheonella palauensis]
MDSVANELLYAFVEGNAKMTAGHVSKLDLANLAEEIESLGKRDRRALRSRLKVLMRHLLKWCYQPERCQKGHSWWSTIRTHRRDIELILEDSPSLRRQIPNMIAADYQAMRLDASGETSLPLETFPEMRPWTTEQILDETFWPGEA